jgi:hypothetical protein
MEYCSQTNKQTKKRALESRTGRMKTSLNSLGRGCAEVGRRVDDRMGGGKYNEYLPQY